MSETGAVLHGQISASLEFLEALNLLRSGFLQLFMGLLPGGWSKRRPISSLVIAVVLTAAGLKNHASRCNLSRRNLAGLKLRVKTLPNSKNFDPGYAMVHQPVWDDCVLRHAAVEPRNPPHGANVPETQLGKISVVQIPGRKQKTSLMQPRLWRHCLESTPRRGLGPLSLVSRSFLALLWGVSCSKGFRELVMVRMHEAGTAGRGIRAIRASPGASPGQWVRSACTSRCRRGSTRPCSLR